MPHYHCPGAKAQLPGAALKLIRAVAGPKLPGGGLDLGLRPGFIQYAEFLLQDTCSAARYINRPTEAHKDPSARAAYSAPCSSVAVQTAVDWCGASVPGLPLYTYLSGKFD